MQLDVVLRSRPYARIAYATVVTWVALGGKSLAAEAKHLADAVGNHDLATARVVASALVGRDSSDLDASELCRAAVESVAENTADAVVGPLLWGAIAGPTGVVIYRAVNTLDAMVGHRSSLYERFGWAAANFDDLLTWPAARLGATLSVALAAFVGGDVWRAWRTLARDGHRHPSPNAGYLEAAFAGAFGIRLGGQNCYGDRVENRPTLGDGPLPTAATVRQAAALSRLVSVIATVLCASLAWWLRR